MKITLMSKTLTALIVTRNEGELLNKCVEALLPYVDEIVVVDHGEGSTLQKHDKLKIYNYEYQTPIDMGAIRTFASEQATSDWIMIVDADEIYPPESLQTIKQFIETTNAISARVPYHNLAWKVGNEQIIEHYPDRLYRRDVIDKCEGLLPNDMWKVKKEFYQFNPILEYDNRADNSFENPVQPIIQAPFYHLARTRGYNYEYWKRLNYQKNMHPEISEAEANANTRVNQWVTGLYDMQEIQVPENIPTKNIPNPKVSIIITNYNYAHYLKECVDSCKANNPHEIIIIDDHSTDRSYEMITKMEGVIFIPHIFNQDVAQCRNEGIAHSTGDYFINVDADDRLKPDFIEKTLEAIGDNQICYTDMHQFGDFEEEHYRYPDFSSEKLKEYQIVPSACALCDRRIFEASGGFDPSIVFEDWGWWLRLDSLGFKFTQVHEPLFEYRQHGKSRIDKLDADMAKGYAQLKENYGVLKDVDDLRVEEAKKIIGEE